MAMPSKRPRVDAPSLSMPSPSRLLQLPAELREEIWILAVTEWAPEKAVKDSAVRMLRRTPVRLDRFNRPLPAGITRVSRQLRHESLHLYYQYNQFELWRPLFWINDWTFSTLIDWLGQLGPRMEWLNDIALMYKHESELDHDIEEALWEIGFAFSQPGVISDRCELSEFEQSHQALGLPRHFGRKTRDRWLAAAT
ncbi:hypothetical protein LTR56_019611 [Elasticomyces elasticus]|nr:hypothetical protein LTR56_019611 [Elasticomyces elasticus]KAK3634455.1 hypothetical protein LTR22_019614 [Elasticomyces elasticus]KAK4917061.1 hypothetical protein LTR49_014964 [Elasticomyces elasticus]KAK5750731.1 hypothetical protein LTS12_019176 [Elasticomyces elasticus]